ncbi:MAG TPA: rhodanese-like domain-containing protein [Vicinamibacterales bacterium]|jgi:rhodanese-related sulfurtransferase
MTTDSDERSRIRRFVEASVSALTVVAATLFLASIGGYFLKPVQGADIPRTGVQLPLKGVDWAKNQRTLVIALQSDCTYCEASMPFYRDLVASNRQQTFYPLVVVPHSKEVGEKLVRSTRLGISDVRQADFDRLRIPGTPALVLVDQNGLVKRVWVGRLSPAREDAVFEHLKIKRLVRSPRLAGEPAHEGLITAKEFSARWRARVVVDTRPRDTFRETHILGALNIPIEELEARLVHEVPADREVVVVCDYMPSCPVLIDGGGGTSVCDMSVESIRKRGFGAVRVLNEGLSSLKEFGVPLVSGT